MSDLLINPCGDLDIVDGKVTVVTGADAVKQRWLIYISTYLGEWFLDQSIGVPYTQEVFRKQISRQLLKQVFATASLEVPGILQVISVVVDSLNVATRFAEVTVTCKIDSDEGPETGQFKFTGTVPPEGCAPSLLIPQTVAGDDQWYWFDPSDLKSLAAPYVAGSALDLTNKFTGQVGQMGTDGDATQHPILTQTLNGRKCLEIDGLTGTPVVGSGAPTTGAEVRALRQSTGAPADIPFTFFGVYQAVDQPTTITSGYDPLITFNGVDADGTTQRWINFLIGREVPGNLIIKYELNKVGSAFDDDTFSASAVDSQDAFILAATLRESTTSADHMEIRLWVDGVPINTVEVFIDDGVFLDQLGIVTFNGERDSAGALLTNGSMRVGEQIGISRHMSDADVDSINNYLLAKWGIE